MNKIDSITGNTAGHSFKVGERVAIYSSERLVGTISEVRTDGTYWCEVKRNGSLYWRGLVHPKQCRRLKRKKRREWRLKIPDPKGSHGTCYIFGDQTCAGEDIYVREAFERDAVQKDIRPPRSQESQ